MNDKLIKLRGKYWHELTDEEIKEIHNSHATVRDVLDNLKQPDWCNYPDVFEELGCWSLTDGELRKKISLESCKDCPCFKEVNHE